MVCIASATRAASAGYPSVVKDRAKAVGEDELSGRGRGAGRGSIETSLSTTEGDGGGGEKTVLGVGVAPRDLETSRLWLGTGVWYLLLVEEEELMLMTFQSLPFDMRSFETIWMNGF